MSVQRHFHHTIAWRRIAAEGDAGVRIVGALAGPVTLAAGLTPGLLQLLVPKHEFDKLGGNFTGVGDIEWYFQNDPASGTPDFTWRTWSIWQVEETRRGKVFTGADGQSGVLSDFTVVERRFTFIDARRKLRPGYGGMLTRGIWNQAREDGKVNVHAAGPAAGKPQYSLYRAIKECLVAMRFQNDFDDATEQPADFSLMAKVPAALKDVDSPRNLDWGGAHAPTELAKLLDLAGWVIVPAAGGGVDIHPIDPTRAVVEPASIEDADAGSHRLPFEEAQLPEDLPSTVIVTSAPSFIVNQLTLSGPHAERITFVGFDADNTVKPLGNLSYLNGGGINAVLDLVRYGVWAGTDAGRKAVLDQAFRYLKLSDEAIGETTNPNTLRVPILNRIVDVLGAGTANPDAVATVLKAKGRIRTGKGWENATSLQPVHVRVVSAKTGIIELAEPLGKLSTSPTDDPNGKFAELVDGDLSLTFAFEKREATEARDRYYMAVFQLRDPDEGDGPPEIVQLAGQEELDALADPDALTISAPQLRLYQVAGVDQNRTELNAAARKIAEPVLSMGTRQVTLRRYRGFHHFRPDGQISEVTIQQSPPMTTVVVNAHFLPSARLADEALLRPLKQAAADTKRHGDRQEDGRVGTQANAKIEPQTPPRIPSPESFRVEITGHTGAAAPFAYQWQEKLGNGSNGARTGTSLKNDAEDPKRLNPTNLAAGLQPVWLAIPNGTRVWVWFDPVQDSYVFDAAPQPDRGPCPGQNPPP